MVQRARRRREKHRAWRIAATCAAAFAACEITLRLLGISYPHEYFFVPDRQLGWMHRTDASGLFRDTGIPVEGRTNSFGFNDEERPLSKPAGVFRIVLLESSLTEAFEVPRSDAFAKNLEGDLTACRKLAHRKIEVVNLSVAGYSTVQKYVMLRKWGWRFEPDFILLGFVPDLEVRQNTRELDIGPFLARPFLRQDNNDVDFGFRHQIRFLFLDSWPARAVLGLKVHVRTLQLIWHALSGNFRISKPPERFKPKPSEVFFPPQNDAWQRAWAETERTLVLIRDDVRTHYVPFLLTTFTSAVQLDPDGVSDYAYPDHLIRDFGQKYEIPVFNLIDRMGPEAHFQRISYHAPSWLGPAGGHWNPTGSRRAAELTSEAICKMLRAQN
jgi:hypothetical protein